MLKRDGNRPAHLVRFPLPIPLGCRFWFSPTVLVQFITPCHCWLYSLYRYIKVYCQHNNRWIFRQFPAFGYCKQLGPSWALFVIMGTFLYVRVQSQYCSLGTGSTTNPEAEQFKRGWLSSRLQDCLFLLSSVEFTGTQSHAQTFM